MARLSLSLLGPFQARIDGQRVPGLHANTVRALLAVLAVERDREHTRSSLAQLLWPEQPDAAAFSNLRYTLSDLRHALGDVPIPPARPILVVIRDFIRYNPDADCWLDVREFDRLCSAAAAAATEQTECECLEEAVALYRGPFLAGATLPGSPAFEDWLFWTREQLQRTVMGALRRLVMLYLQADRHEAAQAAARRQVQLEPLDEVAHRQLMVALALGGERSAALIQYERCHQMLVQELHVEPTQETEALVEMIRAGDFKHTIHLSDWTDIRSPLHAANRSLPHAVASPAAFVARERELEQLDLHLARALAGHGQVVFVTGDAGSGKTALMQEFVRRALSQHPGLAAASGSCNAAAGIGDPYLPFRDILQMLSGDVESRRASNSVTPDHARRLWALLPYSVQALIEQGPDLLDRLVPVNPLLLRAEAVTHWPGGTIRSTTCRTRLAELAHGPSSAAENSTTSQEDLFEQVLGVLRVLSLQQPLVLVLDDLQWADRGTISLLFHLGRRLGQSRILLVGAYRPDEVALGRAGERHPLEVVVNELKREFGESAVDLDAASGRAFVDALLDSEPHCLPAAFAKALYGRTEGHALFTVEMLRALQERGGLVCNEGGQWVPGPSLDWEQLPVRVEAVIAERVGHLPHAWQTLLAKASVEGEEFTAEVVARLLALPNDTQAELKAREEEVGRLLSGPLRDQHLVAAHSLRRLRGQRLSRYRFRHFLLHKYLYDSLDSVERAKAHEAVARALEDLYGEDNSDVAVHLAWHWEQAGLMDKAMGYSLQAGKRAMEMSAHHEAAQHFRRGLVMLSGLPDSPEQDRRELDLQLALGSALLATEGMGSQAQILAYSRAYELSARLGEQVALWPALHALASVSTARGQYQQALELGEQLLALAQHSADPAVLALAHFAIGQVLFSSGNTLLRAREHLEQSIRYYDGDCDSESRRFLTALNLFDLGVHARAWLASALWVLGFPDQALRRSQEALDTAEQLDHLMSQVLALYAAGHTHLCRGEDQALQRTVEALERLVSGKQLLVGEVWVEVFGGWLLVYAGQVEEGLARLRQGTEAWQKTGAVFGATAQLRLLAEACVQAGRLEEGLEVVGRALALVERTGSRPNEAELHRLRGELLLARGDDANAAEAALCFRRAFELAHARGQKGWELRAATSLARLGNRIGGGETEDVVTAVAKCDDAQHRLAAVYAWFSEGFDTPDLREAAGLLDRLASP
jgi:predicted ATPase/DNA-binding SARP family transcriptional activator